MKTKNILLYLIFLNSLFSFLYASEFEFKTFGTIGAVYNDSPYLYRKDIFQKEGSSMDISFETDSIIGLQSTLFIDKHFSIPIQGIVYNDYNGEVKPKIDWGYLKYDSNENITLKIGRIRTPYYKNSDNLNIGYSNLMIRESVEVYGQVPFSSYNGVEASYTGIIKNYFYTIQAGYGKENRSVPIHSLNQKVAIDIDDLYAINLTAGTAAIQGRITYLVADITASNPMLNQLFGGLRAAGLNSLANRYEFDDKKSEYFGFGFFIDYSNILLSAECGHRKIESFFADTHGYYATLGYSFDKLIPFITYAESKMDTATYNANSGIAHLDALLRAQNLAQSSKTAGVKYFINDNLDVKFQYERVAPKGPFGSYHLNTPYDPKKMDILSFALDFIF